MNRNAQFSCYECKSGMHVACYRRWCDCCKGRGPKKEERLAYLQRLGESIKFPNPEKTS